jgi:hydroxymethylbilane synthase
MAPGTITESRFTDNRPISHSVKDQTGLRRAGRSGKLNSAMPALTIGSRGSKLALWQSNWVKSRLEALHDGLAIEIRVIKTTGDQQTAAPLAQIGGKGVFTRELEEALLSGAIDLAVHSLKDLPTTLPDGLQLAAITEREDVRDAIIAGPRLARLINGIRDLPPGARIGTSSLRRASQLRLLRPDLEIAELRGNVDTRLRKLDEGGYDAIILAAAGLNRLGLGDRISARIDPTEMLTAVGQGALAIEARIADEPTNRYLAALDHLPTRHATAAERAVLRALGGGCAVPIAAYARAADNQGVAILSLDALVASLDGRRAIRAKIEGPAAQAEDLGIALAKDLIASGAGEILSVFAPPLEGARIVVTGARGDLPAELAQAGAEVIHLPTIEIRPPESWDRLDRAIERLSDFDWVVLTSVNAVDALLARLAILSSGSDALAPLRVAAIGSATLARLDRAGVKVTLIPEKFTSEDLVRSLIEWHGGTDHMRGIRLLVPASNITRNVIRRQLEPLGARIELITAYLTAAPEVSRAEFERRLADARAEYIIFSSPSTVDNLAALLGVGQLEAHLSGVKVAAIGPSTAAAARARGLQVRIEPSAHTGAGLIEALIADR